MALEIPELEQDANEKGEYVITLAFKDENDVAQIPTSATWTLTKYDATVVNSREDVAIGSPTANETVTLSGNDLAILDDLNREKRIFTVTWAFGGITRRDEVAFHVRNLVAVS